MEEDWFPAPNERDVGCEAERRVEVGGVKCLGLEGEVTLKPGGGEVTEKLFPKLVEEFVFESRLYGST